MIACLNCHGTNVQKLVWLRVNTGEIVRDDDEKMLDRFVWHCDNCDDDTLVYETEKSAVL